VNVVTWNTWVVGVIYYNQPWLSIDLGYSTLPTGSARMQLR
jgi:hypothetical protein